jgi:oxygen-independent coproporphyrinogen-3 oxidase
VLQLKEGVLDTSALDAKFQVSTQEVFQQALANQQQAGYLEIDDHHVRLTRRGLLQADSLLPEYFESEHRRVRYT